MFKYLKEQIEALEWLRTWINKTFKSCHINRNKLFIIAFVLLLIFGGFKLFFFLWPKFNNPEINHTEESISSINQSGGITAKQVIINNISSFKESDFETINHSEDDPKKEIRNKLRQFYGELRVLSDYPIPRGNIEALQRYETRVNKWVSDTSMWIEINIGFAAREVFLNREAGGRTWSSDYMKRFNQLISDIEKYKSGLEKLISSDEMWVETKHNKS